MKIGLILILFFTISCKEKKPVEEIQSKPKISFTFDDGSINDFGNYKLEVWNQLLLDNLKKHNLKAILFSTGANKLNPKGQYLLSSWNEAGHWIANHSYTHPNFNSEKISLDSFKSELIKTDEVIKKYSQYHAYFRFPYLKEGNTIEKRDGFRDYLKRMGYKNGHVTIDASDWYVSSRLVEKLKENSNLEVTGFKEYYKNHLYDRALYYDSLAYEITNRKINHVILLHHNLAAALFLDDLIQYFKDKGWDVIDADKAYDDTIYKEIPDNMPAGESLIWALAKKSGKYENRLRYPAEDGEYEKIKMDRLGL